MRNGLSYKDCGLLGALKTKIIVAEKIQKNIENYLINPKLCKNCNQPIEYKKRINTFCSQSCSASTNNKNRSKNHNFINNSISQRQEKIIKKQIKFCLNCQKECKNKYCSVQCQGKWTWIQTKKDIEKNGFKSSDSSTNSSKIRKYILETKPNVCECCKTEYWQGSKIPLVVDHIDGNHKNNDFSNLRLLCCNCDALTPTYKGKNKGKGRFYRRQRYKNGKSY